MTTQSTNLAKERTPAETGSRPALESRHRRTKPGKEEKAPAPNKTPRKTLGRTVKQPGLAETSQGGRPSILTDALTAQLSHHVAAGNFASTACALVGVSEHSFYNWLNRGERELLEGEDSPYTRFFQSIKKAAAMAEADAMIEAAIHARTLEEIEAATHALDRLLVWGYYAVPHWYKTTAWIAYWNRFGRPDIAPPYDFGYPNTIHFQPTWWIDPDLDAAISAVR